LQNKSSGNASFCHICPVCANTRALNIAIAETLFPQWRIFLYYLNNCILSGVSSSHSEATVHPGAKISL
jgi:hypothetical protein